MSSKEAIKLKGEELARLSLLLLLSDLHEKAPPTNEGSSAEFKQEMLKKLEKEENVV